MKHVCAESISLREVDPLNRRDVASITRLHLSLLGHGPMARLGELFLRRFCYTLLLSRGFMRAALFEVDGRPAGFIAYTHRSITFHREAIKRHWVSVAWLVALSVLRDPRLVARLAKAARLMFSRRAELALGADPLGEVLAIGVRPEYRTPDFVQRTGLSIGEELIRHVELSFRQEGIHRMRMVVEADNKPALLFYHRLGGRFEPYEQAGEPMVHVWFQLEGASTAPSNSSPRTDCAGEARARTAGMDGADVSRRQRAVGSIDPALSPADTRITGVPAGEAR